MKQSDKEWANDPSNAFWLQPSFPAFYRDDEGVLHKVDYDPVYKEWLRLVMEANPHFK